MYEYASRETTLKGVSCSEVDPIYARHVNVAVKNSDGSVAERTSLSLGFTPICALGSANDIVTPTELAPLDVSLTVAVARRPSAEVTRTVIM